MSMYLRKSFRAGPVRMNLSKSGLGFSAGVKGARVGVGPRGRYVHAGRGGLYYRKQLSSGSARARAGDAGCASTILLIGGLVVAIVIVVWLAKNPWVLLVGGIVAIGTLLTRLVIAASRTRKIAAYKAALDAAVVAPEAARVPPDLSAIQDQRKSLPQDSLSRKRVAQIERDVYQAVLDKVLDDGFVSGEEAALILATEQTVGLDPDQRLETKKEIFTAAYLEAIADRVITGDELGKLNNLADGLAIPREDIHREMDNVQEIVDAQALKPPLEPLSTDQLVGPIQKSETAYLQCPAHVLTKRKSRDSVSGFEYSVKRDGTLILTDKRVLVTGEGTTSIRLSEIDNLDVDIDEGVIEVTKAGSGRPLVLKTERPIYVGRLIDLVKGAD